MDRLFAGLSEADLDALTDIPETPGGQAMTELAGLKPKHFLWEVEDRIAVVRLNRPERKNPLTFDSYAELRDTFRALPYADGCGRGGLRLERRQFLFGRRRA